MVLDCANMGTSQSVFIVARNYFRGGDSRAFEQSIMCSVSAFSADTSAKVGFLFYCNKEKKELFVLRGISIIKMAMIAT